MKCGSKRLTEYALGLLEASQAKAVETHVATCPSCAQRLDELRSMEAMLKAVPKADGRALDMDRLRSAIASRKPVAARLASIGAQARPRWRWAAALAVVAGLVVLCWHYGVAIRVGQFEVAVGGPVMRTIPPQESPDLDEESVRRIVRAAILEEVTPGLRGLIRYIDEIDSCHGRTLVSLEKRLAAQLAANRQETEHNFRFLANTLNQNFGEW